MKVDKTTLVFAVIFIYSTCAQLSPEDEEKIDNFMTELMECRGMPGAALSTVKNGETVLSKGYGFANLENQEPVTEHSIFNIASSSKTFTSTLLGKLFADSGGELSWDTVLSSVVEDQFYLIDGYVTNHTKYRDALSHQTGMAKYNSPAALHAFNSTSEAMQKIQFIPAVEEFREEFLYQNWLFMSAMYQLELLTGLAWQDMMSATLLEPLGMDNTTFYEREAPDYQGFVTPYVWDTLHGNPDDLVPLPYHIHSGYELAGPSATVCSSAADMSKWMEFILSGGLLPDGERLMETSDLTRIWYPEVAYDELPLAINYSKPLFPVTDSASTYGLGYWNGEYRGYKQKVVSGDLQGFHSDVFFLPMVQLGIFFVTNFGGHFLDRRFIHMYVADILLGYEPAFTSAEACDILNDFNSVAAENKHLLQRLPEEWLTLYTELGVPQEVLIWWAMDTEGTGQGMPKEVATKLHEYKHELFSQYSASAVVTQRVESYVGVYGEFMHGNLTIYENDACEGCLYLDYGRLAHYTLFPTNTSDVFWGSNSYPTLEEITVVFGDLGEDELFNHVTVLWDPNEPVTFTRGLTMSEAPEFDITSCH